MSNDREELTQDEMYEVYVANAGSRYVLIGDPDGDEPDRFLIYDTQVGTIARASEGAWPLGLISRMKAAGAPVFPDIDSADARKLK
jgi:hypothetical protein